VDEGEVSHGKYEDESKSNDLAQNYQFTNVQYQYVPVSKIPWSEDQQ